MCGEIDGGGDPMHPEDYRTKGAACFLAAQRSTSPSERLTWLCLADIWLKLAELAERHEPPLMLEEQTKH